MFKLKMVVFTFVGTCNHMGKLRPALLDCGLLSGLVTIVTVRGATGLGCLVLAAGFLGWILSANISKIYHHNMKKNFALQQIARICLSVKKHGLCWNRRMVLPQ